MAKLGEGGYDLKAQVQACACSDVETGFQAPSTFQQMRSSLEGLKWLHACHMHETPGQLRRDADTEGPNAGLAQHLTTGQALV